MHMNFLADISNFTNISQENTFIKTKISLPCIMFQHSFCKLEHQVIILHYFYILHISPATPILHVSNISFMYMINIQKTTKLLIVCDNREIQARISKKYLMLLSHKELIYIYSLLNKVDFSMVALLCTIIRHLIYPKNWLLWIN